MLHKPNRSTVISRDGKYRYHLWRRIAQGERVATFIMLNPFTADGCVDDPTIRKCMGFCRRWVCGELHVVNPTIEACSMSGVSGPAGETPSRYRSRPSESATHQVPG